MTEQEQINALRKEIDDIKDLIHKNSFTGKQDIIKDSRFKGQTEFINKSYFKKGKLNIEWGLPSDCVVGDIAIDSGHLYICMSDGSWTDIAPYTP